MQEKVKNDIKYIQHYLITIIIIYYFFFKQAVEIYYHITRELDLLINKKTVGNVMEKRKREFVDMFYT